MNMNKKHSLKKKTNKKKWEPPSSLEHSILPKVRNAAARGCDSPDNIVCDYGASI